jgi:hypothetical protein
MVAAAINGKVDCYYSLINFTVCFSCPVVMLRKYMPGAKVTKAVGFSVLLPFCKERAC